MEKQYKDKVEEALKLCLKKNEDYGSSWRELGSKGIFADLYRKISRLKTLIWNDKSAKVNDETIRDTCLDAINYAVMLLISIDEERKL